MNLIIHLILTVFKADKLGFFKGYDNFSAVRVVVSNISIRLVITAIYKYKS